MIQNMKSKHTMPQRSRDQNVVGWVSIDILGAVLKIEEEQFIGRDQWGQLCSTQSLIA